MIKRLVRRADAVAPLRGWLLVAGLYAYSVGYTLYKFRQWGPDARYYLAWAYRYGGLSQQEAARRTYDFLGDFSWFRDFCRGSENCWTDDLTNGYDPLFHGFGGGLVAPRVLYPLLSAPLVRLLGPNGMLVVPAIASAVSVVLVVVLASRLVGRRWAVLAGFALLLPISMARWSTYAYTEALTMTLLLACVVVLPLGRRASRRDLALFGVFLFLFAFTRQFHPIVVAGVTVAWLGAAVWPVDGASGLVRRVRNEWLPFLCVAVGVTLLTAFVQSFMSQSYSLLDWFLKESGAKTVSGIPAAIPRVLSKLVRAEGFWISGDFALTVLLLLAAFGMLRWLRTPLAQLTFGMVLGTVVLNVLNAQPSNFRYYSNVMPLLAILATAVVADLVGLRPPAFTSGPPAEGAAAEVEPAKAGVADVYPREATGDNGYRTVRHPVPGEARARDPVRIADISTP